MKIIKHGELPPEPRFFFKCPRCKCEFEMTQTELRQCYQSLVYVAVWKCPECNLSVHGDEVKEENIPMENKSFTFDEIERAIELYCSDCCLSCDECGLWDFKNFELSHCLAKVVRDE